MIMIKMNSMMRGLALYGAGTMANTMGARNKEMSETIIDIANSR